ncbi:hypothetical protein [Streptomyces netropsis]|uniref:Uncharacterized protein n=1 Tax=Streptomyces netropsis TaxID=55404 RepID=A0A7W7L9A6_STRNE|nr:hypothetical protein [Streptomyces netropsis]MBB4885940.1 hypothetical protein [Streptomyces netropsis]GGR17657.1 hypothetical protein GCM10010219_23530 [Streptomyces netropsis]
MSYSTSRTTGHTGRTTRLLTGALAIAALVAALVALWQTQFRPLTPPGYCWGTWPGGDTRDGGLFQRGVRHRTADERAPTPERPSGHCALSWRGGRGPQAYHQRVTVRLDTGPRGADQRRSWLDGLFAGGGTALPGGLPGFVAAGSGALVLPESCDVDGRPSVVSLTGTFTDSTARAGHPGFPQGSTPEITGKLLIEIANRAINVSSCASGPPLRIPRAPVGDGRDGTDEGVDGRAGDDCAIPALAAGEAKGTGHPATAARSSRGTLRTCAVPSADGRPAIRFAAIGIPRLVALFDGLTGDRPPAPGWRAHGRIEATRALVRADCAGRPTVFALRTGPGRTHTRLDDARVAFPALVDEVARRAGCARLRT